MKELIVLFKTSCEFMTANPWMWLPVVSVGLGAIMSLTQIRSDKRSASAAMVHHLGKQSWQ